jgi:ABC-type lipoprotein release transport system permease subunit
VTAIGLALRAELRTTWRSVLALGLVVGLAAAAVLTFAAGARRTETAYERFLVAEHAYDVIFRVNDPNGGVTTDAVRRLSGVRDVVETGAFFIIGFGSGVGVLVPPDERIGATINGFKMLEGRRPDPTKPNEAVISFTLADQYHLGVGDKISVFPEAALVPSPAPFDGVDTAMLIAARDRILDVLPDNALTIVGIEAAPGEFPPQIEGSSRFLIHTSPALYPYKDDVALFSERGDEAVVRLDRGAAGTDELLRAVTRLGGTSDMAVQRDLAESVNRSLRTQADALSLLSLLTAIAAVLIFSQLLARFLVGTQSDVRVLSALGLRRSERWLLGIGRVLAVGFVAAPIGVIAAAAASGLFPTGLARIAEPDPGLRLDGTVLLVGFVVVPLVVALVAAWPAWRAASTDSEPLRPRTRLSWWARQDPRWKGPAPVDVGIRMALQPGRNRRSVAGLTSLGAVVLGLATLVGALVFGASLSHLLSTPALYGRAWDAALTTYGPQVPQKAEVLARDPRVAGVAKGSLRVAFDLDGHRVDGVAIDSVAGHLGPTIVEGRGVRAPTELVVGTRTLRALGRSIGDRIPVAQVGSERTPVMMTIVGRAVFPLFAELGRLGDGGYVSRRGWAHVTGRRVGQDDTMALVKLKPGASLDAVVRDLKPVVGDDYGIAVISQGKPTEIVNFGRVERMPYVLGAVLAVVSIATLGYILVSTVLRRRRELAILKTIGFVRRQVRLTVVSQATAVAAMALVAGIPLGVILGRFVWRRFANDLGIVPVTVVPVGLVVATALVVLIIANVVAVAPARLAGRTRPAEALRTE